MSSIDTTLTLGGFKFEGFEVPEKIPLGGSQSLVIHKLPGGDKIIQSMGRDDDPIQWNGLFLGGKALDRARELDTMRVQGRPVLLAFLGLKYNIIIKSFKFVVETFFRVSYTIELEVIEDLTQPNHASRTQSLNDAVSADSTKAVDIGTKINDSPLTSALATMDSAIKSVSDFAKATQATINSVLAPIAAVQQRVTALIGTAGNTLNSVTTLGGILPNNPIAQQAARLTGQVTAATQLPLLYNLQSVASRITTNLNLINSPLVSASKMVGGGTLFDLSAKSYGDATKWAAIAQANKISDPNITSITKLTIPNNPINSDGLYTI